MIVTTQVSRKVLLCLYVLLLGLLSLSACQKKNNPSFIIIAIDRLSFNAINCPEDRNNSTSGFTALCQEGIRYANSYSTSTHSTGAIGSLLTGLYPIENKLHRAQDRITPQITQLPEVFKKAGYRTAFFSANANIMKRTGLSRGFDLFEDSTFLNQSSYTTPFTEQFKQFKNWVEESHDDFFAFIYNSDLETLNDEQNYLAKVDLLDEKLGLFFQYLKSNQLWEKNYIIVTGLQGRSDYERLNETNYSNLHSENMNISFFIKPPRQKGDEGISLKLDRILSLADIGYSLIKIIEPSFNLNNVQFPLSDESKFWTNSRFTKSTQVEERKTRQILFESPNTWEEQLTVRLAVLNGHNLFIESDNNQLFNRITDGLETIDTSLQEPESTLFYANLVKLLHHENVVEQSLSPLKQYQSLILTNQNYWFKPNERVQIFEAERLRLAQSVSIKLQTTQPLSTLLMYYQNNKKEKDTLYEEARRVSYNLAFENIWGLWSPNQKWPYSAVKTEYQ